jgi:beta-N-acetylhexosaminidase
MREGGIASCGKHFPGYSRAPLDAHHELPVIPLTRSELNAHELAVFRHFIPAGRNPGDEPEAIDSMMVAHAQYPYLEPDGFPGSLSRRIITGLLREEFGFTGLVMTDDLDMGAILNHYSLEETIRLAIGAGNDLAMICHRVEALPKARETLDQLPAADLDRALGSVARFKEGLAPPERFSEEEFRARDGEVQQLRLETLGPELAGQRSAEDGKRSPVEIY